jgi:hypothetical protein
MCAGSSFRILKSLHGYDNGTRVFPSSFHRGFPLYRMPVVKIVYACGTSSYLSQTWTIPRILWMCGIQHYLNQRACWYVTTAVDVEWRPLTCTRHDTSTAEGWVILTDKRLNAKCACKSLMREARLATTKHCVVSSLIGILASWLRQVKCST